MKLAAHILVTSCRLALLSAVIPALLACSGESGKSGTATVSLSELQSQLGYRSSGSALTAPTADEDNPATSVARSIVVGPMVVRSRSLADGPYSDRTPITDVESQLEDDLRNSSSLIVLRNLPTAEDTVEIELPPPGSDKWQLVAAALSTQPANVGQLGEPAHQDSVIYIGFGGKFLGSDSDGNVFELNNGGNLAGPPLGSLSIGLQRACLVEPQAPPKGCAQYNDDGSVVISSAVEIVGVYINDNLGANLLTTIPNSIIVRSGSPNPNCSGVDCSPAVANGSLTTILTTAQGAGTVNSIEVHVTHQLAPNETPLCAGSGTTIADLTANCDVKVFYTPL